MSTSDRDDRPLVDPIAHLIDNQWVSPAGSASVPVIDPATEECVADVPIATVDEVRLAVQAARRAFDDGRWSGLLPAERASILRDFGAALWERREEIARIVVRQGGATVNQAHGLQVYDPIRLVAGYADLAERSPVDSCHVANPVLPGAGAGGVGTSMTVREPAGVVAAITGFNYPFLLNIHKVAAALAAGCTVVLKPTEYACLDAVVIAKAALACGLPAGVLNVLVGGDGRAGDALVRDPDVDRVSFTGSTATGRRIMAAAADTLTRVTLELGGKSARVVFADADLDRMLRDDHGLVIRHAGQGCSALSRVLVERPLHDELVARMVEGAKSVVVGPPDDTATVMGPLATKAQLEKVKHYVELGLAEGAELAFGGGQPSHLTTGYYFEPTIFTNVKSSMRIARDEIFGPVVTVQPFDTEQEAVQLANDSEFGLVAQVWSADTPRALRVAGGIRAGSVTVNGGGTSAVLPHGGFKQSGIGREFGRWGVDEYTEIKSLRY